MAPYTMSIEIINQTPGAVSFVADARLPGDGYVEASGNNVSPQSTGVGASLLKGGGKHGLFMVTLFSVPGCSKNLLVWSSMSAASNGEVIVKIAFVDPNASVSTLPDICYDTPERLNLSGDKSFAAGSVADKEAVFQATIESYDGKYPDSTSKISVKAFVLYSP